MYCSYCHNNLILMRMMVISLYWMFNSPVLNILLIGRGLQSHLVLNVDRCLVSYILACSASYQEKHVSKRDATTESITSVFKEDWKEAVIWSYSAVGIALVIGLIFHFAYWRPRHKKAVLAKRRSSYKTLDDNGTCCDQNTIHHHHQQQQQQ